MKGRLNWKQEEEQLIKYLRNQQKIRSWNKISQKLNIHFPDSFKNGKQCRERYCNNTRFSEQIQEDKNWTRNEDQLLSTLYLKEGPRWTFFMKDFPFKSQNTIKNRFYCCLRKATRKLRQIQGKTLTKGKNIIKCPMLITILQIANRVEKEGSSLANIQINQQWDILKLKRKIVELSFLQIQKQQVKEIAKLIHNMNNRFKSLGITKQKNKSKWKLTKKRLYYILGFEYDIFNSLKDQKKSQSEVQSQSLVEKKESIQEQYSFQLANLSSHFQIFSQQKIVHPSTSSQFLEKQFCQILGLQYDPIFSNTWNFY